jgi:hypothetical protein
MIQIDTFDKISIKSKTLVLSDIDETILFYDKIDQEWWKKKIDYYINVKKYDSSNASIYALDEWFDHIKRNLPNHTDKIGFEKFLENIKNTDSKLIFITARHPDFKQITEDHFNYLGLKSSEYEIHYLGGSSKGKYIKNNIDTDNYDNILFIDDLDHNIMSVNEAFPNNNKLTIYKFIMKDMN